MLRKLKILLLTIFCVTLSASASVISVRGGNEGAIIRTEIFSFIDGAEDNGPDAIAYQKAYKLVLDEKWKDAIQAFSSFLKSYPKSSWRDDAGFWLCYSKEKAGYNLEDVFKSYQDFIKNNRRSKWADDARSNMIAVGQKLVQQGKVEYKTIIDNLQKEDNEEISITALYALQNMGDEKALDAILKLYDSTHNKNYKGKIIYTLGNFNSQKAFNKIVQIAKTEKDPDLQKKAVYALANTDKPEAIKTLKEILSSSASTEVRKTVLYALGNTRSADIIPTLKNIALTDKDIELAKTAVYALGNSDKKEALDAIKEVLKSSSRPDEVRKAALYALGNSDNSDIIPFLTDIAINEPNESLAKAAVYSLGNSKSAASSARRRAARPPAA